MAESDSEKGKERRKGCIKALETLFGMEFTKKKQIGNSNVKNEPKLCILSKCRKKVLEFVQGEQMILSKTREKGGRSNFAKSKYNLPIDFLGEISRESY